MALKIPAHRWQIAPSTPELTADIAAATNLDSRLAQVLVNRGVTTAAAAKIFIQPELVELPSPLDEFPDLVRSLDLLVEAIELEHSIAICGDYDADGMTSTALLIRALSALGAKVDYAIPSRMKDGYGINRRIVEEFHGDGVKLIITVDNGISAVEAIARAVELGVKVIITDHHDLPQILPPADAILNPKLIATTSIYRGIAGVGVAYILALALAEKMLKPSLSDRLLELFTLGTIADLAPLTGINRQLVKQGLQLLPKSQITGVRALIQMSGTKILPTEVPDNITDSPELASLKPEDIGFRLGPRINAIGRIDDPQIIIELLTTDNERTALARAIQCEQVNKLRQDLCANIEAEAIELVESGIFNLQGDRVLVIVKPDWHHGVIGIVASRLVERYGVPVFIGTNEEGGHIRGSARGIPEFDIFGALEYCHDLLGKYGGHRAAGGFSLDSNNLDLFRQGLSEFAHQCLELEHLKHLINIDVESDLGAIDLNLYGQIDAIHPCGIENPDPVFWSKDVRVINQRIVGKGHLQLTIANPDRGEPIKAIAWRFGDYFPVPRQIDIAYKLRENIWKDKRSIQLEIVSFRLPESIARANFNDRERHYDCFISADRQELTIVNQSGYTLQVRKGEKLAQLIASDGDSKTVDVTDPKYFNLVKTAKSSLGV